MRGNELLDKMELIDFTYVEAADDKPKKKKNIWAQWGAMAACLCLVIIGIIVWKQHRPTPTPDEGAGLIVSENGVTIPKMNISLSTDDVASDMVGFFIYQGRCYVQYDWIDNGVDIIGEYLGTSTGLIHEWTPKEGYVELAGSVKGNFYTVKGYDPAFLLCMKEGNTVLTYICNNGITLKYGSELYENRLHLSDNLGSVQYESRDSWYHSKGERYQMNSVNDIVLDFIKCMDSAEFVPQDLAPLDESQTFVVGAELYHLYFILENGMTVHLRLYEKGYVRFQGILEVYVQIPEENYSALLDLLDNHTDSKAVEVTEGQRDY